MRLLTCNASVLLRQTPPPFALNVRRLHQKAEGSDRKCVALAESVRRLKHELLASKTEGSRLVTELQNTQDELNERFARLRLEYSEFQANAEKQVQELQMETERAKRYAQHVTQERVEQGQAMAEEMEALTNKLQAAYDSRNARCIELEKALRRVGVPALLLADSIVSWRKRRKCLCSRK